MAVSNRNYWADRFKQLEAAQNQSSRALVEEMELQMRKAEAAINHKIDAWYGRLASNNNVSMEEARRMLNAKELEEFRWELEDYIRYGEKNAINGQWMQQLENASARAHISHLEQLKLQVQQEAERLYGNCLDQVDGHMRAIYENGFYRTAYEIQRGIGFGASLTAIDTRKLEKVIKQPWAADGRNFSERIWSSKQQLIDQVHTSLTQMCILGQGPDKAIRDLAKAMKTSRNQAGRLIMTESAFFSSTAQKDCFNELGVEEYEIVATLDSHTSEICQIMDGQHFPMSEYKPGATAPPFHVWCRSCTCPYFDDEFSGGMRAARGEDGKTYYVDSRMTYPEWKRQFVESESDIGKKMKSLFKRDNHSILPIFSAGLNEIPDENVKNLLLQAHDRVSFKNADGRSSFFRLAEATVYLGKNATASTVAHELFHEMDHTYGLIQNGMLSHALENDYRRLKNFSIGYGKTIEEMLFSKYKSAFYKDSKGNLRLHKKYRGIADILNGVSNSQIYLGFGHKPAYWKQEKALERETFAQFGRILYDYDESVLKMLSVTFPECYEEVMETLKGLVR